MPKQTIDLCFITDCTGSMASYITAVKNNVNDVVNKVREECPDAEFRVAFVAYRDWCDGAKRLQYFDFSEDIEKFQTFVGSQSASGGGDEAEDVLGGLQCALGLSWASETRVLYHSLDAPPHNRKFHNGAGDNHPDGHPSDPNSMDLWRTMSTLSVDYYIGKQNNSVDKMIQVFKSEAASIGHDRIKELAIASVSELIENVYEAVSTSLSMRLSRNRGRDRMKVNPVVGMDKNDYQVYVGVDFGTHGTAYAFSFLASPETLHTTNRWEGPSDTKVLTNILLDKKGKFYSFGYKARDLFLEMDEDEQKDYMYFRRFKMALFEKTVKKRSEDDMKEGTKLDIERYLRASNGKKIASVKIFEEALTFIREHAMESIEEISPIDPNNIQWILTVPAIWSQRAKDIMIKAGKKAKMISNPSLHDQLEVAFEPECASIAIRKELGLKPNDVYLLLDCGGGTIDIACHKIIDDNTVEEVHHPTGGPWGSTYIDDAYMEFLHELFGHDIFEEFEKDEETTPSDMEEIIVNFQKQKEKATASERQRAVPLGAFYQYLRDEFTGDLKTRCDEFVYKGISGGVTIQRGRLILTREIWYALFSNVTDHIVSHTQSLLSEPELSECKTICLVGGFAESSILNDIIQNNFSDHGYRVFTPRHPILAVVKGAARYGLIPTSITSRRSPKSYGLSIRRDFKEGDDDSIKKKWDPVVSRYCVDDSFFPFVRKGQPIEAGQPPIIHYFSPVNPKELEIKLYESCSETPRYITDDDAHQIGILKIELPDDMGEYEDVAIEFNFEATRIQVGVHVPRQEPYLQDINYD